MRDTSRPTAGVCSYCHQPLLWGMSAKRQRPVALQLRRHTVFDDTGHVHSGHEVHIIYCPEAARIRADKAQADHARAYELERIRAIRDQQMPTTDNHVIQLDTFRTRTK